MPDDEGAESPLCSSLPISRSPPPRNSPVTRPPIRLRVRSRGARRGGSRRTPAGCRRPARQFSLLVPFLPPQPLHLRQHFVQTLALDELHGEIVYRRTDALRTPDADVEDGDDIRVVQPCRRAGLAAEALEPDRIAGRVKRQRFQGDVPAERFLPGFVDDAPATAGHFADD